MQATVTKTVPASIDRVWQVLSDHEGMTGWAPGLTSTLTTPGAQDRNGLGAVRRISTPLPVPAIVEEIVAFEPERRLEYKALSGVPLKHYSGEVVLTPSGKGTTISYSIRADQRVPLVEKVVVRTIAAVLCTALVRAVGKAS